MLNLIKSYQRNNKAAIAVAFAIMAPVIVGAAGMGIDYARAHLVQQRLAQSLDAAALAAVASATETSDITNRVKTFFAANFPEEKIGVTFDPVVTVAGDDITVSGVAKYPTSFLNILGVDTVTVAAETVVKREVRGIEAVLVLDVTGSMGTNNNIGALRTAAKNFVEILYERATAPDLIKIGLVPYSTAVNVGPYGLGYDLDGGYYGSAFVNNPDNLNFKQNKKKQWHGCVEASDYPLDTQDHEGPWDMYSFDCGGAGTCQYYYENYWDKNSNNWCNKSHIIPLTSDTDLLLDEINDFQAQGSTLGNQGMVWGYRVLSPEAPFEEASDWDNKTVRRAIVMMTDGQNFINNYYTAYGPSNQHSIDNNELNNRFAEVCETMKDEHNIAVYTITFTSGVSETTKDYYRDCATSTDQYYDAPNQDDLIEVFEKIGRELSNIHISR